MDGNVAPRGRIDTVDSQEAMYVATNASVIKRPAEPKIDAADGGGINLHRPVSIQHVT